MDKYLPPDSSDSDLSDGDPSGLDDFEDFMLGIRDDRLFSYNQKEDITSATAAFKQAEGNPEPFFEFNPLDSLVPSVPMETLHPDEGRDSGAPEGTPAIADEPKFIPDDRKIGFCRRCGDLILHNCSIRKILSYECLSCTPIRIPIVRFLAVERKLFRKTAISRWDSPAWYREVVSAYKSRQILADVQPSQQTSRGTGHSMTISQPKPELEQNWKPIVTKAPGLLTSQFFGGPTKAQAIVHPSNPEVDGSWQDATVEPLIFLPDMGQDTKPRQVARRIQEGYRPIDYEHARLVWLFFEFPKDSTSAAAFLSERHDPGDEHAKDPVYRPPWARRDERQQSNSVNLD